MGTAWVYGKRRYWKGKTWWQVEIAGHTIIQDRLDSKMELAALIKPPEKKVKDEQI